MQFSANHTAQIIEILKEKRVAVAYLFGSLATNSLTPLSDVDIAILFDSTARGKDYSLLELTLAKDIGRFLETNRVDIINLETSHNPLLKYHAVFSGTLLFANDPSVRRRAERRILSEYEDTRHLRNISSAILHRQIKEGRFGATKFHVTHR